MRWIEQLHPRDIDLGLAHTAEVLARMSLPATQAKLITVAGTNGKGSSVAFIEAIMLAAGYRVGCYTSPHLLRYNERVRILGQEVSDAALCQAFTRVEAARADTPLTYFEFGTLAALSLLHAQKLDAMVLEVGMGGRLDAVNVMDADVALITSIGMDHIQWLGTTREGIAREKAGILRPAGQAVCIERDPPVSLTQQAQTLGVKLYQIGRDFDVEPAHEAWHWRAAQQLRSGLPYPVLRGRHQLDNAAGVLMVLSLLQNILPLSQQAIREGLLQAQLPGRFQTLPGRPLQVLDVAHNPQAAQILATMLAQQPVKGRTLALVGMLKDKDIPQVLQPLMGVVDSWYLADLTDLAGARTAGQAQLSAALVSLGNTRPVTGYASVAQAYSACLQAATESDRIVVFGSFYTVGDILRRQQD